MRGISLRIVSVDTYMESVIKYGRRWSIASKYDTQTIGLVWDKTYIIELSNHLCHHVSHLSECELSLIDAMVQIVDNQMITSMHQYLWFLHLKKKLILNLGATDIV